MRVLRFISSRIKEGFTPPPAPELTPEQQLLETIKNRAVTVGIIGSFWPSSPRDMEVARSRLNTVLEQGKLEGIDPQLLTEATEEGRFAGICIAGLMHPTP